MSEDALAVSIGELQRSYLEYMARLKAVLDFGDVNIEPLMKALNHKHANPVAKALGLMMYSPAAAQAIPSLLEWLVVQSPLYPDVLEALVRAGDKPAKLVCARIQEYAEKGDDEAVRHLFDLASRFSSAVLPDVIGIATRILKSENSDLRETAADAIWKIGLPYGLQAVPLLKAICRNDESEHVRKAALEALGKLGSMSLPEE